MANVTGISGMLSTAPGLQNSRLLGRSHDPAGARRIVLAILPNVY